MKETKQDENQERKMKGTGKRKRHKPREKQ
jgi:hypothetical protein